MLRGDEPRFASLEAAALLRLVKLRRCTLTEILELVTIDFETRVALFREYDAQLVTDVVAYRSAILFEIRKRTRLSRFPGETLKTSERADTCEMTLITAPVRDGFRIVFSGGEILPARRQYGEAYPPDSIDCAYQTKSGRAARRKRKLKEEQLWTQGAR